jgi:hypothetical protein
MASSSCIARHWLQQGTACQCILYSLALPPVQIFTTHLQPQAWLLAGCKPVVSML